MKTFTFQPMAKDTVKKLVFNYGSVERGRCITCLQQCRLHLPLFFKASSYVTLIKMDSEQAYRQLFRQIHRGTSLTLLTDRECRGREY
jgi:hypothetical protein